MKTKKKPKKAAKTPPKGAASGVHMPMKGMGKKTPKAGC